MAALTLARFRLSRVELYRASLILHRMATSSRGAEGVKGKDGKEEMIDKPMVLQVRQNVVRLLRYGADFGVDAGKEDCERSQGRGN